MLPPHNAWVEGFCGSAALTLAKPAAPIEIINDLNNEIVNLFEQLRDRPKKLCEAVALTPYANVEFDKCRVSKGNASKIERARRFLVQTMMTVNGTVECSRTGFSFSQSYARENREARVNRWYNLPERLETIVERLRNVRVENKDARSLLKSFADRPATLVYLDPPYFTKREHGYVIDANDKEFHEELLDICVKAKCMILLSGYANGLYKRRLTTELGWKTRTIKTVTRDTAGKEYDRTEVLWVNGQFVKARENGRVPVRLSQKEKRNDKINPRR